MSVSTFKRLACNVALAATLGIGAGCAQYVTRDEFDRAIRELRHKDSQQDRVIEDTAAKLACNDPYVQDFVRRCKEDGSKCDTSQIVTVVSKMRAYHHKVMRLPYVQGQDLTITEAAQEELVTLFKREHNILPSTKLLLVAIPSHQLKGAAPARPLRRMATKPVESRMEPDISTDIVAVVARNLRKSFQFAPYALNEKIISGMEPQVPACESRSDELIRHFREIPANRLRLDETKIRAPWIDLIIFMVDCQ